MRCITCANYYLQTDFNLPRAEEAPPARGIGGGRSLTTSVGEEIGEGTRRVTIAVVHNTVLCENAQLGQNGARTAKDGGQGRVLLSDCEQYSDVFSRF